MQQSVYSRSTFDVMSFMEGSWVFKLTCQTVSGYRKIFSREELLVTRKHGCADYLQLLSLSRRKLTRLQQTDETVLRFGRSWPKRDLVSGNVQNSTSTRGLKWWYK